MSIWSISQDEPVLNSEVSVASLKSVKLSVCGSGGELRYSLPQGVPSVPSFLSINGAGVSSYVAVSSIETTNSGAVLPVSGVLGEQFYFTGTSRPCWWSGSAWLYSDGTPAAGP
jgi:hypothetical protein